jgi:hypothetical protein
MERLPLFAGLITVGVLLFVGALIPVIFNLTGAIEFALAGSVAAIVITITVFWTARLLARYPAFLSIAMLGHPGVGKTVYLTMLFDSLQRGRLQTIRFSPAGRETVERVAENLTVLSNGLWLPGTMIGEVFPFRAHVSRGRGPLTRQYRLEIADHAGQNTSALDPRSELWLHKADFFKYVIQSDALIIAIDTGTVLRAPQPVVQEVQNSLVAAFQLMVEEKGLSPAGRLKNPVALVFMKGDLAEAQLTRTREQLASRMQRLIDVCSRRCQNFEIFVVSAVGSVQQDGAPPNVLKPIGVTEPLGWILSKFGV